MRKDKFKKIKRIALAAALSGAVLAGMTQIGFSETATDVLATVAANVQNLDFAAARSLIAELQQNGIAAILVGSERITLEDLLAMIAAAEAGQMQPAELAAFLRALAENTALAVFIPTQGPALTVVELRGTFPIGSEG